MRKLLLIGALGLIAAAAFAQTAPAAAPAPALVFTGALYTGTIAQNFTNGNTNGTTTLGIWDPINQTGSRLNLQGTYSGAGFGLYFRLREDDNWDQGSTNVKITGATPSSVSIPSAPTFRRLYGYIDAANGMIRIAAGRLSGYEWATGDAGGFNTFGNLDGAVGMQLQVKPVDGLNVGAFLPFTYGTSSALVSSEDISEALDTMAFGAKYTIKGVADIEGGYWLAPISAQSTGSSSFYQYPVAWLGAEYVGMPNLTVILESRIANSANTNINYEYFDEQVSFALDQLAATLYAEQFIYASTGAGLAFRPVVDYSMGMFDIGAFAEITYVTSSTFANANYSANGQLGYSGGPFVKATFAKNVYLKATGEYGGGGVNPPTPGAPLQSFPGNLSGAYQNGAPWGVLPGSFWQVNLNFVVSF
jgi:hypothetical protein